MGVVELRRVRRVGPGGREQGQVLPLVAVVVLAAAVAAVLVAVVGGAVIDRTRARTAADAAALAGVTGGRVDAERVARANGGRLRRFAERGGVVEVTVRVGRAEATARAELGPARRRSRRRGLPDSGIGGAVRAIGPGIEWPPRGRARYGPALAAGL